MYGLSFSILSLSALPLGMYKNSFELYTSDSELHKRLKHNALVELEHGDAA